MAFKDFVKIASVWSTIVTLWFVAAATYKLIQDSKVSNWPINKKTLLLLLLHPNISIKILHTVLYTFAMVPTWPINKKTLLLLLLHPNISIKILHTVLYTFAMVPTRIICVMIMSSSDGNHFLYPCDLNAVFQVIFFGEI